jgi:hypothetical protein
MALLRAKEAAAAHEWWQVAVIDASTVRSLLRIFLEPQWQYHFSSPPVERRPKPRFAPFAS